MELQCRVVPLCFDYSPCTKITSSANIRGGGGGGGCCWGILVSAWRIGEQIQLVIRKVDYSASGKSMEK